MAFHLLVRSVLFKISTQNQEAQAIDPDPKLYVGAENQAHSDSSQSI
jgi:hypothetical protein